MGYYYTAWTITDEAISAGIPVSTPQLYDMQAALRDAVDIAPEFVPAAEMLAETQLLLRQDLAASVKLLVKTLQRSPGRESLLMLLARVSSAAGDKASAGWMLQHVIASGGTSAKLRSDARVLLSELNLTTAQKTAFGDFQINDSAESNRRIDARSLTRAGIKALSRGDKDIQVVRGFLTEVQCSKGLTLYIRVGVRDMDERVENLHTDSPGNVEWLTDTGETLDAVKCEKRPVSPVAISYKPKRKGLTIGEPLTVEFCRGVSFDCDFRQPPPPAP